MALVSEIPPEIHFRIADYLNLPDILNYAQVCTLLRDIVRGSEQKLLRKWFYYEPLPEDSFYGCVATVREYYKSLRGKPRQKMILVGIRLHSWLFLEQYGTIQYAVNSLRYKFDSDLMFTIARSWIRGFLNNQSVTREQAMRGLELWVMIEGTTSSMENSRDLLSFDLEESEEDYNILLDAIFIIDSVVLYDLYDKIFVISHLHRKTRGFMYGSINIVSRWYEQNSSKDILRTFYSYHDIMIPKKDPFNTRLDLPERRCALFRKLLERLDPKDVIPLNERMIGELYNDQIDPIPLSILLERARLKATAMNGILQVTLSIPGSSFDRLLSDVSQIGEWELFIHVLLHFMCTNIIQMIPIDPRIISFTKESRYQSLINQGIQKLFLSNDSWREVLREF